MTMREMRFRETGTEAAASGPDFAFFFRSLWGREPFRWQTMLAERVSASGWPSAIDLPTAAGKTACIDIAVWALAMQADRPMAERTAARRIWFVVDRRVVVDEAFGRARAIAERLSKAADGPLKEVADRLRTLSGTDRPLAPARLRGGILLDDGWARIPSQPAVITSTVDQLGSRLLFRGYGHSLLAAPIFAGLAANDSLIILDEAHCAVPFMQTLRAIERYRGPEWAEEPIRAPFAFVLMSATPPQDEHALSIFPGPERTEALSDATLRRRLHTSKPAKLVTVRSRRDATEDPLVAEAVQRVAALLDGGNRRIAVMVNRVRTAMDIEALLRRELGDGRADVVLLTGRLRPFERDKLVARWTPYLRAEHPEDPERPIVVVSTQCLEVGADFSFDALVTEAASLDALRQRFGRLARLGSDAPAPAVILARESDIKRKPPDFVYGEALASTWRWLVEQAAASEDGEPVLDMGVEALQSRLEAVEDLAPLLAPSPDAPVLLPAHLDLLCQTAPPPSPDPDVSWYLHGRPAPPEVFVVWRCDLTLEDRESWLETVALCPPVSGEMLQAPLWRVRSWLADQAAGDDEADIEGRGADAEQRGASSRAAVSIRPCLLWRGRDRSQLATRAEQIEPGDVVVVPASYGIERLGQATRTEALGEGALDLWDAARAASGQPAAVRVHRAVLRQWSDCAPVKQLLDAASDPALDRESILQAVQAVLEYEQTDDSSPPPPPEWWRRLLAEASNGRVVEHPAGGAILIASPVPRRPAEPDLFADDDDLTSAADQEVSLEEHSLLAQRAAEQLADRCLPEDLRAAVSLAAFWHDAGKLDPRFQLLLRHGDEVAWAAASIPLAKSAGVPTSPARRRRIREASGLPERFRHEMLSMELARRFAELPEREELADLVLHLVASHHGHGRPFAPICVDPSPPAIRGKLGETELQLEPAERTAVPPAHRLDSGLPERFWRLNRRYGWWGLAYLEALVRLADWYASNFVIAREGAAE